MKKYIYCYRNNDSENIIKLDEYTSSNSAGIAEIMRKIDKIVYERQQRDKVSYIIEGTIRVKTHSFDELKEALINAGYYDETTDSYNCSFETAREVYSSID